MTTITTDRPVTASVTEHAEEPMPVGFKAAFLTSTLHRVFSIADLARSNDDSRPILGAFQITVFGDDIRIRATDSYRIHIARGPRIDRVADAEPVTVLVKLPDGAKITQLRQMLPKTDNGSLAASITLEPDGLVINGPTGTTMTLPVLDYDYPMMDRLISDSEMFGGPVTFNPAFFTDLCKAANFAGGQLTVTHLDPLKPCQVHSHEHNGVKFDGLLMPVRTS